MAADEPPYLTIGTDVSAKYKGAFCEAKVKKVNRIVKCKVTFKNNLGSFVLTDDLIKGPLRIAAEVEAKHPEKNQFLDAVINKLQDYSQYTVVFDDGDETTLRRTSLCLKSGRHFAESPTLDQFPLTNPEHFGTPVIGSGKFKRKRRSTVNSSLDYESSDEESLPRKLRGKDTGKVVCVDYGDRRKKDNWYPGLIVPQSKVLKDEHLIRSFKDGKYYQVPKRDIRDFTKECGQKVENNALRTAVEKAILYLEKEELPPHWDKVLYIGLDDEESNDSESDTSDDEPSEEKDRFVAQLYKFMDERGTPINKAPTVSNRDLNLYKLFKIMHKLGGYNKVTNKNKWKTVYSKLGLPHSIANGPNQVKTAYKRYLQSFEDFYRKLGCTMVNNTRSTRGRHRSDRNIIITRTRDREVASPKSKTTNKEAKEKSTERKTDEKPKASDKKEAKSEETPVKSEEKTKTIEKKKTDEEKVKKEEKRRVVKKEEESKPEKARTREDARKEKNDSPEKKGTRSSLKVESEKKQKEEPPKEKKAVKEKNEEKPPKPKKEDTPKEKKIVREREKRVEAPKEKVEKVKGKAVIVEEKSPKRKLERNVKKDLNKSKVEEPEEKPPEELTLKKSKSKTDLIVEEETVAKPEEVTVLEEKKSKPKIENEEESPSKSKKRSIKGDEKDESLFDFTDSDESESEKGLKKEIEVGDRVKVKYGRGRMQKVYEAKVLKTEADGLEKRYYVHYAGWNMRYDEWVRKNYIVAIVSGNKKFDAASKNPLPPSSMKKQDRSRAPGLKSVRKISTSSSNSNVSRSTRSEKKEDSDSSRKLSKKDDANMADTSQESDSDRDEDEDGNDADIEDSSALQTDSCFKEELFSEDEEKDKPELDKLQLDITIPKSLDTTSNNDDETSCPEKKLSLDVKTEEASLLDSESVVSLEKNDVLASVLSPPSNVTEKKAVKIELVTSTLEPDAKLSSSSDINAAHSTVFPDLPVSKPSVLSFSGLIQKVENPIEQEPPSVFSELSFMLNPPKDEIPAVLGICKSDSVVSEDIDTQNSEPKEEFTSTEVPCTVKTKDNSEDLDVKIETEDSVKTNDSVKAIDDSEPCTQLFDKNDVSKETDDSQAEMKIQDATLKSDSPQSIFIPSFSPQNLDQSFSKLRSDNNIQSETVDVSKMIPGILERLKNDVATEEDAPSPLKNDLPFDFLRDSSNKCMSRSDSSSSLRICESDTNDSNTDSKDLISKQSVLPVSEICQAFDSLSKSSTLGEDKPIVSPEVASTDNIEMSHEGEAVVDSVSNETDKPTSNSNPIVAIEVDYNKELTLPVESCSSEANNVDKVESVTFHQDSIPSNPSCTVSIEDSQDLLSNSVSLIEAPPVSDSSSNLIKACDDDSSFYIKENISKKPVEEFPPPKSDSPKEALESYPALNFEASTSQEFSAVDQISHLQPCSKDDSISYDGLKNLSFALKKEGKKKKFSKKFGKKSELVEKVGRESKISKNKAKKKMRFEGFSSERMKSLDIKSKKLKKNKNKKRFKHEDSGDLFAKKGESEEIKDFDKVRKKEKKKCDKKFLKCGLKSEDGDIKTDLLKKKKMKKNREKLLGERKDYSEKKAKKKRKLHLDHSQDTDSEKEILPKIEKKRKKKKPKTKVCSSSDDCTDKFFKEETLDASSSHVHEDSKVEDPDMSFLLCEEKVPASPVDAGNLMDSGSSSIEEDSSELMNITNSSTVIDNTPPTTPSSTESLLSSSPSHERDSFPYPESTQSGRESCEGESDLFRCGNSNRTISRGSEEYHAATTLAFAVCQSVSEKIPPSDPLKQPPSMDHQLTKRKKKSKRFRRLSETAKSPKHKLSFLRTSKIDNSYEESSGTSLATLSSSPPYGSLNFSKSLPSSSEDLLYIPLHEKDPEKRIALLQKRMGDLRKQYLSLRAEVIAIDHKRRKARKKVRETAVGSSPRSDEAQSCF